MYGEYAVDFLSLWERLRKMGTVAGTFEKKNKDKRKRINFTIYYICNAKETDTITKTANTLYLDGK